MIYDAMSFSFLLSFPNPNRIPHFIHRRPHNTNQFQPFSFYFILNGVFLAGRHKFWVNACLTCLITTSDCISVLCSYLLLKDMLWTYMYVPYLSLWLFPSYVFNREKIWKIPNKLIFSCEKRREKKQKEIMENGNIYEPNLNKQRN